MFARRLLRAKPVPSQCGTFAVTPEKSKKSPAFGGLEMLRYFFGEDSTTT